MSVPMSMIFQLTLTIRLRRFSWIALSYSLALLSFVTLKGADTNSTNLPVLQTAPKSAMELLTNSPPIKSISFRREIVGDKPENGMICEGGIQGADFWFSRIQRTEVNGKLTDQLTSSTIGRWGTTNWGVRAYGKDPDYLEKTVAQPALPGLTNPVVRSADGYRGWLLAASRFGLTGIQADSIRARSESEFIAQHWSGVITGRFEFGDSGRPLRLSYQAGVRSAVHDFKYSTNVGLSFYPNEITVSIHNTKPGVNTPVPPTIRYLISSFVFDEGISPAETFLPERWIQRTPRVVKVYTNNAWALFDKNGKRLRMFQPDMVSPEMTEPQRKVVRVVVILLLISVTSFGLWWARKTNKQKA